MTLNHISATKKRNIVHTSRVAYSRPLGTSRVPCYDVAVSTLCVGSSTLSQSAEVLYLGSHKISGSRRQSPWSHRRHQPARVDVPDSVDPLTIRPRQLHPVYVRAIPGVNVNGG